ncbi:LysR family transcriptional regulator [Pseudoclavibacter sp. RFBJ3]|uniref:LysR family transcriptional regulator n=1 Tax=unclassified Pseudoclavibacter TaxID=2615177 RepID=UPI000CE822F4|nr:MULTISPECIES: LysR family transcriptional regulator [unclassified Pseudoclavibacter]PPF86637.1 LysR family transcriptional regulator [Pseudoclavibacter sp. RFBJ5]PPF94857.1 LysR family transcriptional regulator [Pseudoclavibacter sp. RFBH5]PPF95369.1 LysR family transcriptional regulator [Pseudoclavibacter sp. RFBJ3]PPG19471.1 LysR family transcriptional regulator [Pseudoclavibacter sp. RFBI4]
MYDRRSADLPDFRGLAAFDAVLAAGSVSAAATALGWSHPTVDHHLKRLEQQAGTKLLERGPRGSVPTAAGTVFAPRARQLLEGGRRAFAELDAWLDDERRLVRFGIFPTLGALVVPGILSRAEREQLSLELTLDECERLGRQLEQGRLDAAVLFQASDLPTPLSPEITTTLLFAEPLFLAVPREHPLATAERRQPVREFSELRDDRWAFGASGGDTLDEATREHCRRAGFEASTGMRSDDYPAILGMIAAGQLVAVVPASVASWHDDAVAFVPIDPATLTREVVLATREEPPAGLRAAITEALADLHAPTPAPSPTSAT